ncbi:two-component system, response regulator YesN [Gracilibacillus orientalis]|uniref:Two-component system, response regulator YesN n=1 Tax=Gracilibacillus orientalis TaxID=334253 RepID=A0A1I4PGC2_9BACI|nr:response regulator [Gracilibacillus orientalis]SFM26586.1 two-component system, response regulator YesN [Gracilibacillus orientalis]
MKVVIAEDEFLERKAMHKFLEEHFSDIEQIEEAVNGRKAIELAESIHPDIMLMDIKMPGINGLEAMEAICRDFPLTKFIMLTAYDSFDYAKQAMKLGVREYILKPSKKEEIIRAFLNVKGELEQDKQILDNRRALFLTKVIQGEDADMIQPSLCPDMQSGFFMMANKALTLSDDYITQDNIALYISNQRLDNADVLKQIRSLQLTLGDDYYIGAGHPYDHVEDLTTSYYQAKKALRQLFKAKQKNYGFASNEAEEIPTNKFLDAIRDGEEQKVWVLFDVIAPYANVELFVQIKQIAEDKGVKLDTIPEELVTTEDWKEFMQLVCREIKYYFQSQDKIVKAKQFIANNYHKQINLMDVSAYTELSTNYVSNLFHEATGSTFIDYLTEIRIKKAKQLLQTNNATLKEISYDIGYKDPNYFSRVFKKHVGLSPKQYQSQIVK